MEDVEKFLDIINSNKELSIIGLYNALEESGLQINRKLKTNEYSKIGQSLKDALANEKMEIILSEDDWDDLTGSINQELVIRGEIIFKTPYFGDGVIEGVKQLTNSCKVTINSKDYPIAHTEYQEIYKIIHSKVPRTFLEVEGSNLKIKRENYYLPMSLKTYY